MLTPLAGAAVVLACMASAFVAVLGAALAGLIGWRYLRWVLDTGGDVEAAVKEVARDD